MGCLMRRVTTGRTVTISCIRTIDIGGEGGSDGDETFDWHDVTEIGETSMDVAGVLADFASANFVGATFGAMGLGFGDVLGDEDKSSGVSISKFHDTGLVDGLEDKVLEKTKWGAAYKTARDNWAKGDGAEIGTRLNGTANRTFSSTEAMRSDAQSKKFASPKTGCDMAGLVKKASASAQVVIAGLDTICSWLGLQNPVDYLIRKPFFGDWDEMEQAEGDWLALASQCASLSDDFASLAQEARAGAWQGNAGEAFAGSCDTVSELFEQGVEPCQEIAEALEGLEELAKNTLNLVLDAITTFADIAESIQKLIAAGSLAWTGIGALVAVVEGIDLAGDVIHACEVIGDAIEAINQLLNAITAFCDCTKAMNHVFDSTQRVRRVATS